ncbi:hypothetical protein [Microtetraspora fusca]|uniref:hypothetical protein n=1 Tax=Microtetraspora fusca TaxID=1997 RepID=UPI000A5F0935|nr:hypothetical protein [Microtetraspora fusca]
MSGTSHPAKEAQPWKSWFRGLLLWFGVLGGVVAWALHLITAWGLVELVCHSGHTAVAGMSLHAVVITATVLPAAIALAALATAWWTSSRELGGWAEWKTDRIRFTAQIGLWLDGLAAVIILFGGGAVATFQPCVT